MEKEAFTPEQEQQIKERYDWACAVCGRKPEHGIEVFVRHILGGQATLTNGQVLCEDHNHEGLFKDFFVGLHGSSKELGDEKTENFAKAVLKTYEKHDVNGHIEWKED